MKRQIRNGVFETNSSSVHSLTICTESEYHRWIGGEMLWDSWYNELVEKDSIEKATSDRYCSHDEYLTWYGGDYEKFYRTKMMQSGENVTVFGYYGYDG